MTSKAQLTALQLSILRVLWDRGEARVPEVCADLKGPRSLAKNTVATVLSRLEKQGVVTHRTEGRQFVYSAVLDEQNAQDSMVVELAERAFEGDKTKMFAHLLGQSDVAPGDLERIKDMIEARERELNAGEEA